MKSKTFNFCYLLTALFIGSASLLTSCDNQKDVYDPNHIQEEAKKAFPVKNIDPNQTWEMSSICNASVSVNEKTGGTYTIKVYTENPYNTNGDASLLAKTSVTDGQTVNFKFDIPSALQFVYVMKVNSEGYSSAIPATVENGVMKAIFGETGTTRATTTKADGDAFFKPELPKDKTFPTTPPANCGDINDYKGPGSYLLNGGTYSGITPSSGADIYIQGNVTLSSWSEPGGITNIYLLPDATLTLGMEQFNHRPNSTFSIGTGAKLIASNTVFKGEEGSDIFNKGTIIAKKIEPTNSYWYNASLIETKEVLLTNNASKFCNAPGATLKASELTIAGNGHFLNETDATVEVSGKTILNCSGGSWENAGHYTTATMHVSAWNKNVKNTCWLSVTGELKFTDAGVFNENYIECNTLHMNNTAINMTAKSFIEVKNEAEFAYNPSNRGFGFIAPTSGDKALLRIKKAIRKSGNDNIAYSGNLYVACNDHFATEQDQWNIWYVLKNGAELSGEDNASIKIDKTPCNPGYNSTPDGGGADKVQNFAYVFEDMTKEVGDYDFNDVVLYVTSPIDGKITATLKAAGATKQLAVRFKNQKTGKDEIVYDDVHAALGVSPGTITNTGTVTGKAAEVKTFEVGNDFNIKKDADFYIVNKEDNGEIHIAEFTTGLKRPFVPYAIRVACANWKWPKERTEITKAYTKFMNWAQDMTSNLDWYSDPESIVNENVIGID